MEKSETETLKEIPISQTNSPTVSRRGRPLRSRTLDTFLHILSVCYADSSHISQASDKGSTDIGSVTEHDAPLARTEIIPNDLQCQEEISVGETRVVLGSQEGSLYNKHAETAERDHHISGGRDELPHKADKNTSNSLDNKSQDNYDTDSSTLRIGDQQSVPELHMEELNGQIKVDREVSNDEVCDALEPYLDVDEIVKVSDPFGENNERSPQMGKNALEDVKHEAQHVEREKPVSVSALMNSSPHLTVDKDFEEGEISGEFMDFIPEDDTSSVDKTRSEVHFPEDLIGREPHTGLEDDISLIPLCTDTVDDVGKDMEAVVSKTKRNLVDYSEIAGHGKTVQAVKLDRRHGRLETREPAKQGVAAKESDRTLLQGILKNSATKSQDLLSPDKDSGSQRKKKRQGSPTQEKRINKKVKKSVSPTVCPENPTMLDDHSGDASQEVVDASANKQDDANKKKKKRGLTKERKAKKKHKDRIKRAEKNRKLGVKRLKLQPVIKEKKITYCRHYMKGRCHEGENCKFSHDTIPLTKSKPCCHFARHSCMKGDDCPFDHQLSKYPCNNYLSKGFCSRGSDCMFSHETKPDEPSLNASNESRPELKSSSLVDNSGSIKHTNVDGPSWEKADTKSSSTPISATKNTDRNLVEMTPKLSARPPKGISFLSQGKLSLESRSSPKVEASPSSTKFEASLSHTKVDDEIKGCEITRSASEVVQNSNEITKTTPVAPRGINFLSFGKKPGLDSSNSSFSLRMVNRTGKSPLSNMAGVGAKSDSTENGDEGVKVDDKKQVNSDLLANGSSTSTLNSSQKPILPYMSSSLQKALQSTLAFASKFESGVKTSRHVDSPGSLTQKS